MITLHEFYTESIELTIVFPDWRYGQALFNNLLDVRPNLAEQVRGTTLDPFHKDSISEMDDFFTFIEKNWYV